MNTAQVKKSLITVTITSINVDVINQRFTLTTKIEVVDVPGSAMEVRFYAEKPVENGYSIITAVVHNKPLNLEEDQTNQIVGTVESAMYSYLAKKSTFLIDSQIDAKAKFNFELVQTPKHTYSLFTM